MSPIERVAGAQTISRALSVLGLLRSASSDMGVTEIARELSLHTSTAHRILRALVADGYVAQSAANDRYRLGREAFLLGRAAERDLGFDAVMPVLERVCEVTGESINLVVRDGDYGLVVLRVESKQPLRFTQPAGTRIPLYCTSTGKALLAFTPDVNSEVAGLGELQRLTSATITSGRQLLGELEQTRERGYSINKSERIQGVCGVAAPVLGPGGTAIAAIAVQGPEVRMPDSRLTELGGLVIDTARETAATLPEGYRI